MVFEGILVSVLNRFLGPYVKNLDPSQLKIGIWGGDVVLEKLELKENALEDLDLPIRVFGGYLERLRLKIPWKGLYSDPVVAELDGVYVLAGPASAAKYDAEEAAKEQKERKDKQLKHIEEAKKKAKEQQEAKEGKEAAPGFVEKLITQIVRNVQITVRNIHIRYEDAVTNPSRPFSFGVTLDSLFVQSTDESYKLGSTVSSDPTFPLIYKVIQMNCLAAYLNSHHKLFGSEPPDDWREILKNDIARPEHIPSDLEYMVRPISARAEVQMTTNPKRAGGVPQALVCVELKELAVMLGKQQFHSIMGLVESFDRMTINQHFLKYKPVKPVKEDLKAWWRYAITAVLEEDVKRRTQMWSWKHIVQYRKYCRDYTEAYTKKLLSKSVSTSLKKELEELEGKLSVFNITICRQRAENRAQERRKSQEIARSKEGWWSWATGWGRSAEVQEEGVISDEDLQLEREKLYEAIGYSENAKVASYPKEYVAQELRFQLNRVTARLYDGKGTVAHLVTQKVCVTVKHRPTCKNLSVAASVETLAITGRGGENTPPTIVSTQHQEGPEKGSLLEVEYELHPLEREADQFIKANLLPIEIIYDADTVDAIVGMFLLPKHVQLQKLSEAAASTLEDLKTQTRAGLEHAINQRKLLDLDITLHSPYLVVPENGVMTDSASVLVADLGLLRITSDIQYHTQSVRTATVAELEEAFYDHFNLKISDVHVMVSGPGDDWRGARLAVSSPLHILRPTGLQLQLKKSLLPNDTRLPSLKVGGELPNLTLSLSDKKIKQVLVILHKLPIPPPSLANKPVKPKYSHEKMATPSRMDTRRILGNLSEGLLVGRKEEEGGGEESDIEEEEEGDDDSDEFMTASEGEGDESSFVFVSAKSKQPSPKSAKRQGSKTQYTTGKEREAKDERKDSSGEVASTTKLWLQFTLHEIGIHFSEHQESTGQDTPRLNLTISSVGTTVTLRSWDLCMEASVGSLTATDHYSKGSSGDPGTLLVTESSENASFLSIKYCKYDRSAPHYPSLSGLTEQSLEGSVSLVKVRIQRESLANLTAIARSIVSVVIKKDVVSQGTEAVDQSPPKPIQDKEKEAPVSRPSSARRLPNERDFHLDVRLAGLDVTLCDSVADVVRANITGLSTEVDLYKNKIAIAASMSNIAVLDSEPGSVHPKVITKVEESQEIISVKVTMWQGATQGTGYSNLKQADLGVEARVQRLRVTIPLRFINRMKDFVTCLLTELKLDPSTIDSAREAAAKTASRTAEALKEQSSSRVRLSITVQAPVVVIPFFALSQSALVADLGQLEVSNEFLFASDLAPRDDNPPASFLSSSGLPAIVDRMTIRISSIQLGRVDDLRGQELVPSCEHVILKPLKFEGHVTRRLSGWCTVIPAVDVGAKLETIEVCFSPADFEAVMSVVASLDEGKMELEQSAPAPSPSAAEEKDRGSEREEKEEIATDPESSTSAGAASVLIRAAVESVKLLLHSTDGVLADVSLQGLSTDVSVLGTEIQVKAELSNIEVRDLSFTNYPKIVSLSEGAKAIKAQVVVYTAAAKGSSDQDMNQCDLSVGAQVGRIRVAVLFLFINRLLCFVKQFEVSRKTIESAKKSAQESATAAVSAVQGMHQNGQRLKLDIQIDAPEIIIPVSSQSNEALVIDLGQLNLLITFHQYPAEGARFDGEKLPIYENLSIMLTNLHMYRTIYDKKTDGNIACRRQMLEPFTLDLCLKRNLSAAWYKGMPTIDVAANLGTLQMLASGDDINMVCCVLTGNFREGSETRASLEAKEEEKTDESKVSAEKQGAEMKEDATDKPPMDAGEEPYESVKFSANLQSIALMLYKTSEVLDPLESSSWNRDPDLGLAQFTLFRFQAAASVQSTGAIEADVSMENCIVEDCRSENRGNITKMVEKVHGDSDQTGAAEVEPMIAFKYQMSQWKDVKVFMKLDGVQVLVDVKFIKTLNNFIMTSIKPLTKPIPLKSKSGTELQESKSGTELQESKPGTEPPEYETLKPETHSVSSKPKSETVDAGTKSAETSKITVRVVVTKPRIALLESSEQSNSSALVLGTAVDFMLVMAHGQLSMDTQVKELCIASTWYKSLNLTNTFVLAPTPQPISASLNFLQGSNTIGRVSIPSLEIVLSPATVRLILHVAKLVAPDKSEEDEIGITAPIDLFKPKALDPWKWYFNPSWVEEGQDEEEEEEGEGEGKEKDEGTSVDLPDSVGTEEITMEMDGLKVLIERELPTGGTSPVVAIAMGKYGCKALTLSIREWSGQLTASAEISVEASYFSRYHECWEPLLEPITDPHDGNKYMAWTLAAEVERPMLESGSDPHQPLQEELPPELAIKISSKNALQLTFTKTSLRILMELVRAYTEVGVSEEVDAAAPETREAAYKLVNKLGKDYPVTVEAKQGLKIHGAYSKVVKYHGGPLPLHPTEDWPQMQPGELPTEGAQRKSHILQLQIENFYPLEVVLGPYEKIYYPLRPYQPRSPKSKDGGNDPPIKYGLVVEIDRQAAGRTPTVTLRSPVQIVNHMDESVEVFWTEDTASHAPPTTNPIATVGKDSTAVLPLREAHLGQFFLRPKIQGIQTCHFPLSWRLPNKTPGDIPCYPEGTIPGDQSSGLLPHYIRVNVDPEVYNKMPLSLAGRVRPHHIFHLHYPLLVHNLLPAVLSGEEAGSEMEIQAGMSTNFRRTTLSVPHKVSIRVSLDNHTWSGSLNMGPKAPEYSTLTLSTEDQQENNLVLMVHKEEKSTWHLSFYSPYWVVNKTTLTLQYCAKNSTEVYTHPPSKTITLYPHKNIQIRMESDGHYSEWSQPFSLDALGSEGIFSCTIWESVYRMGTELHMSFFGLGKVVTISPFYIVYNMTRDDITFFEAGILTETTTVPPMTLVPFWPKAKADSNTMQVAVNDPELLHSSVPFQYTGTKCLLMRTNGKIPAVEVEIQVTASANIITFNPYYTGVVPLQLVNDTDFIIEFQQGSKKHREAADWLEPGETVMYTWDDPLTPKEVIWNLRERPEKTYRVGAKDDSGDFALPRTSREARGSDVSTASTFSRASRASRSSRGSTDSTDSTIIPKLAELGAMAELGTLEEEEGLEGVEEGDEDVMGDSEEWEKLDRVEDDLDQPDFPRRGFFKIGSAALRAGRAIGGSFTRKIRRKKKKPGNRGYWISFMDGLQRVVLFTANEAIQKHILEGNKTERAHLELTLSLSAVGISLVNDLKRLEVAYIGLPSSDTVWETAKHVRWKPVARNVKDSLENLYKDREKMTGVVDLTGTNFWVDFTVSPMMLIDKKSGVTRKLRRSHFEGLFAQVDRSKHHTSIEARISNVQIDNQIPFALNPTILHAWPPPPVLSSKLAPKPFIEVSLIVKHTEQSNVNEIKLLQVLIQEMGVTLDMAFILAMIRLTEGLSSTKVIQDTLINEELERSFLTLEKSKVAAVSAKTTRNYFRLLHLSPLHLHLSFSLEKSGWENEAKVDSERNPVFGFAINGFTSLATVIGRTKDAELKLGYFELENITSTDEHLRDRIMKHYVQEAAVNMYNVVLGLEVLGNPAGFIKGLKEGAVGLFYQPFEGAVLGPEEFFKGLSLGGRQFLGGTIGGFSGLVGRVTGLFGDTLAGLTFDKEFKAQRKQSGGGGGAHSTSVGQGLEGAAKGLYEGVTGIVKQPIKGAKTGGIWGFVKGTGKGFVGVFVKPLGGLVDLTSATLTAVQKKTHVGDTDVTQIRAARFIGPDKIVYPYSVHKAEGYALFLAMDNGRLAESDTYFEHVELVEKPLKVLLVTSNRFAVIKRNEFFDKLDDDWRVDFSEIAGCSSSKNNVISIPVKEQQVGGLAGFLSPRRGQRTTTKTLTVKTVQLAQKAVGFINQAYEEYRAAEKLEA